MLATLMLAALTVLTPHATFDAGIVHVQEYGNRAGTPIIFVPCLSCGPWVWNAQITALSPQYDVYALSLPGFDGRAMVDGNRLTQRAAASIHALITTRHLRRAVIVGHSLGGTIAVLFGETYPRDAADIVTVEGGYPVAPTQAQRDASVARSTAPYRGISQAQLAQALKDNMLQYTITRKPDVQRVSRLAGRSDPRAIVAWMQDALSLDLTPNLSRIRIPFTVIIPYDAQIDPYQGYKTADAKLAAYRAWVAHTRLGRVVLIRNSRHFVMIDQPRAFEQALESAIMR